MLLHAINKKFELAENIIIEGFVIPKGFKTDFASIPLFLVPFIGRPTKKEFRRASILHDFLLVSGQVSSTKASKLFKKVLIEDGTNKIKANIMYLGVRYLRVLG